MKEQELLERITLDPKVMVGKPVIKGTRLTVEFILSLLAHGATTEEILAEYDGLTPDDIRACVLFDPSGTGLKRGRRVMQPSDHIHCADLPCTDVRHECYLVPAIDLDPEKVSIVLISEAAAPEAADDYYATGDPLFAQTTVQAFRDAGAPVSSIGEILDMGVYLTTAVKCGKTGYGIVANTIKTCSLLLEHELALFPHVQAYLLMGDVAIKALNAIARRGGEPRVIPAGSTYKIRGGEYHFRGARAYPSYLQAGPSFFIEKSKRTMIAEDIASALRLIQ